MTTPLRDTSRLLEDSCFYFNVAAITSSHRSQSFVDPHFIGSVAFETGLIISGSFGRIGCSAFEFTSRYSTGPQPADVSYQHLGVDGRRDPRLLVYDENLIYAMRCSINVNAAALRPAGQRGWTRVSDYDAFRRGVTAAAAHAMKSVKSV
jgi:hypothetical protein